MEKQYRGYKIEGVGKGKADYYVYTDLCKGCGLCIAKCPMNKAGKKCLQWSKMRTGSSGSAPDTAS